MGKTYIILRPFAKGGNSPNVIKAAQYAIANGAKVLGLIGFDGGKLKELSDINLYVPSRCYEVVEDVHSFFTHALVYAEVNKLGVK